ncbi:hypothetical protein C900_01664 [Fulvivirga imtechensis AK7]|uniref:Helix-turn-helix type 11 domain-containing protein n=1 Tax=Fulvivirga imtechensis AK7 TaxID=1237149 RepID=L8JYU5_9BACT|nr:hypothetical protein [Fulvivirga imtechensis]ELR72382.1 hypothetical protein C900_01664 [Fulvivirga imtechensis AK7]
MSIDERRTLYLRLDRMIRMKVRGNAAVLAHRLGISRSTFFRCLDDMKNLGAPIGYNEFAQHYYYIEEGCFAFGFVKEQELMTSELVEISGGWNGISSINLPGVRRF